jgi:hypothetical protein
MKKLVKLTTHTLPGSERLPALGLEAATFFIPRPLDSLYLAKASL